MRHIYLATLDEQTANGQQLTLPPDTSHHLSRVLRSKQGDKLLLFNGQGLQAKATISSITKHTVEVEIDELLSVLKAPTLKIHLGIGVSKGKRMDSIMQKATELGVTSITPLLTEHLAFKFDAQQQTKKIKHWQQIIINACEQSENYFLPQLNEICALQTWQTDLNENALKLCLHPYQSQALKNVHNAHTQIQDLVLLIGPEGGLSEKDLQWAKSHQFMNISLGPRILRTETAPIAMLALAQYLWGDF